MNGRDVVRLVLLSAPRRPIVTKHAHRTFGVPLRVNCSGATRKQLRGPLLSVRECVAVCRSGIATHMRPRHPVSGARDCPPGRTPAKKPAPLREVPALSTPAGNPVLSGVEASA